MMYKFTNGIVVFDKITKDRYEEAGYKMVDETKSEEPTSVFSNLKKEKSISKNDNVKRKNPTKSTKIS